MINQPDAKKRGKSSRNKGSRAELELAKVLRERYGCSEVRRGYVFHHESDLVGLYGIHVECKRQDRLNIHQAMEQAIEESEKRKDGMPAVFFRRDKGEWMVTQRLSDWIDLYKEWAE